MRVKTLVHVIRNHFGFRADENFWAAVISFNLIVVPLAVLAACVKVLA